ncbi:MAG: hypothetical protein ABH883_09545, partial [Candidatus Omnitrophota bacterium]
VLGVMAFFTALIAGVLWYYYRRKISSREKTAPLPPYEIALAELDRIEGMGLIGKGKIKEYYYLISICMRTYLENRFSLRAPEQTTEEFLKYVSGSSRLARAYIELLKDFMYHCDLVKYAKLEPGKPEADNLLKTTRHFIEETKPAEPVGSDAPGKEDPGHGFCHVIN